MHTESLAELRESFSSGYEQSNGALPEARRTGATGGLLMHNSSESFRNGHEKEPFCFLDRPFMTPGDADSARKLFVRDLGKDRPADRHQTHQERHTYQGEDRLQNPESLRPYFLGRVRSLRNR